MNTTSFIGRLTQAPESHQFASGTVKARLRIAIPRRPGREGEDRGAAFVDVETWGRQAELCAQHLTKGRRVGIMGRLEQDEWTDESGTKRQRVIVVADSIDWLDAPRQDNPSEQPTADTPPATDDIPC